MKPWKYIYEKMDRAFTIILVNFFFFKGRTYYLAADTEQEMNTWVQWLCHVCGLKPEDQRKLYVVMMTSFALNASIEHNPSASSPPAFFIRLSCSSCVHCFFFLNLRLVMLGQKMLWRDYFQILCPSILRRLAYFGKEKLLLHFSGVMPLRHDVVSHTFFDLLAH